MGEFEVAIGDRILQVAHVVAFAYRVFGSQDKARSWLRASKQRFDGRAPLDLTKTTPGAAAIRDMLGQIDAGQFA